MKARKLVRLTLAHGGEAEHGHVSGLMTSDAGRPCFDLVGAAGTRNPHQRTTRPTLCLGRPNPRTSTSSMAFGKSSKSGVSSPRYTQRKSATYRLSSVSVDWPMKSGFCIDRPNCHVRRGRAVVERMISLAFNRSLPLRRPSSSIAYSRDA